MYDSTAVLATLSATKRLITSKQAKIQMRQNKSAHASTHNQQFQVSIIYTSSLDASPFLSDLKKLNQSYHSSWFLERSMSSSQ